MTTLLASIDVLFGRDTVTGGLAIGCIAALLGALYFAQVAHEANHDDDETN